MFPYQQYNMDKELLDCLEIIYNLINFLDNIRLVLETEKNLIPIIHRPFNPFKTIGKYQTVNMSLSPSDDSTVSAFLSTLSLEEHSHLTPDLGMVPIHNAFPIDSTNAALLRNYPLLSLCSDNLKHQF